MTANASGIVEGFKKGDIKHPSLLTGYDTNAIKTPPYGVTDNASFLERGIYRFV
jgi:hypothetical protein